jgi:predicted dienelactone hydrolase
MGPWLPVVAPGAPVSEARLKGLILISHGTGGTELNHHNLGTRLARDGYLVAAVRHAGDNWQDRSLITSGRYFSERPLQISRVLDALLASPGMGHRASRSSASARWATPPGATACWRWQVHRPNPSVRRNIAARCRTTRGSVRSGQGPGRVRGRSGCRPRPPTPPPRAQARPVSVPDPRIRAVVALAPMAVVFTPESLGASRSPCGSSWPSGMRCSTASTTASLSVANLPQAQASTAAGAGHFAFMAQASFPLPSAAGDAAANPPGFDRLAFLPELENQVAGFFADQWR